MLRPSGRPLSARARCCSAPPVCWRASGQHPLAVPGAPRGVRCRPGRRPLRRGRQDDHRRRRHRRARHGPAPRRAGGRARGRPGRSARDRVRPRSSLRQRLPREGPARDRRGRQQPSHAPEASRTAQKRCFLHRSNALQRFRSCSRGLSAEGSRACGRAGIVGDRPRLLRHRETSALSGRPSGRNP